GYGICTYLVKSEEVDGRAFLDIWEKREQERREEKKSLEDAYVRLARRSLESYITKKERILWEDVKGEILASEGAETEEHLSHQRAGAFVSLHKQGQLRGCIGTIMATRDSIADEIIENAISASTRDPRFSPVTADELSELEYSVDILGETEPVSSEKELDVRRYGVIVTKGMKRGLLLPNLDGVDTVEEQLKIAKQKAGLSPEEKGCTLERFEVVRHL
ncbi:MAG: AmmeMemoRadiSam system protein A, partial [Lachnospiraceae bacterium]|nr:AmmeMemoRadiSam system protein A [Lachnospiraceae bacterium]